MTHLCHGNTPCKPNSDHLHVALHQQCLLIMLPLLVSLQAQCYRCNLACKPWQKAPPHYFHGHGCNISDTISDSLRRWSYVPWLGAVVQESDMSQVKTRKRVHAHVAVTSARLGMPCHEITSTLPVGVPLSHHCDQLDTAHACGQVTCTNKQAYLSSRVQDVQQQQKQQANL